MPCGARVDLAPGIHATCALSLGHAGKHSNIVDACRFCGDPNVVFTNKLGPHCADCYADGREAQQLHEAGL